MKFPQLVGLDLDEATAGAAAALAHRRRWVFAPLARADAARTSAREPRPTVLLARVDPADPDPAPLRLFADLLRTRPEVAAVAVFDRKLSDDDRPGWAAVALDLGAAAVLYPPVEPSVLDDLLSGLMAATIRRAIGTAPAPPAEAPIDLQAGDFMASDE